MPYVVKAQDKILWPVTVSLPVDGGQFVDVTVNIWFHRLGLEAIQDLRARTMPIDTNDETVKAAHAEFFDGIVAGWPEGEFVDEEDRPIRRDSALLSDLLRGTDGFHWAKGLRDAWIDIQATERQKK